jgi:hypothetical protein
MPDYTSHFQLQKLYQGDSFSTNGQQYTSIDRDTIDRLLYLGAEGHHHDGAGATSEDPTAPPDLALDQTAGYLPAGNRISYVYTFVDPSGAETAPSPITYLDLPAQASTPVGPVGAADITAGSLQPGGYFYELSIYTGTTTNETPASPPVYVTLSVTGQIDLTLPLLSSGGDGFNVYRLAPAEGSYTYLASIDMTGASPPSDWLDDGTYTNDPNRLAPTANTTQAQNNITVTVPGAPLAGWTWNLYRTVVDGVWTNSLLAQISTLDDSGNLILVYQDLGLATGVGAPPAASTTVGSPTKVLLTAGAEVEGILPATMVEGGSTLSGGTPTAITFVFTGSIAASTGIACWVCPFTLANINTVICSLGRGSMPAVQAVVVDVLKGTGATPTYSSIYSGATPNPHPIVSVGQQVGASAPPNITNLALGDTLSVDILHAGGGTIPTDHDLTVTIEILVTTP